MRIERGNSDFYQQNNIREKSIQKNLEKMATGKRINRASDDAAAMAMSQEMEKFNRGYQVASENIQAGISALQISDGGASTVMDMLQRQRELAVQSATGTMTDEQRHALDQEYQGLSAEIDRQSQSTDFNGQQVNDGSGKLSDGSGKVVTGGGGSDVIALPPSDLRLNSLGLSSSSIDSQAKSSQAISDLDAAMRKVSDNRSGHGAVINQLNYAYSQQQNQLVNGTQAQSNIEDLDYAKAVTEQVRDSILFNANNATMGQTHQMARAQLMALLGS